LIVSGNAPAISGGGSPLLWQHLFWFLGHPEVYVLILPAMGIVAEIIANNTRKPLWGYKSLVYSVFAIGFLSFIVWAHHMYLTGMGTKDQHVLQTTTMIISIPSVIILTCLFISLWGGSIRFNTPMLFSLAFLPMFGIGGLTGLPAGFQLQRPPLHDTYYVIAHFPLCCRARDDLRALRRHLLLVPEDYWPHDERILGQGAFPPVAHFHEPRFPTHVRPGLRRHEPPHVGRWRYLRQFAEVVGLPQSMIHMNVNISHAAGAWAWRRSHSSSTSSGASGAGAR
jgi:hypothetical protein